VSRYDLFRRRIAPIAFLLAIALIARDSCEKDRRSHTTVELELGDARSRVREIDVDVMSGDAAAGRDTRPPPIATQRCIALPDAVIGPCRFALALPDDDGELQIDIDLGGEHRRLVRRFHAIEGSTLLIPLADDLKPRDTTAH
jgi:hypothetical protein